MAKLILLLLVIVLCLAACSRPMTTEDIFIAEVSEDGLTVRVGVDACPEEYGSSVAESTDSVTIEMRVETKQGDCGFEADVELSEPLGTRQLVDAYDQQRIPLAP